MKPCNGGNLDLKILRELADAGLQEAVDFLENGKPIVHKRKINKNPNSRSNLVDRWAFGVLASRIVDNEENQNFSKKSVANFEICNADSSSDGSVEGVFYHKIKMCYTAKWIEKGHKKPRQQSFPEVKKRKILVPHLLEYININTRIIWGPPVIPHPDFQRVFGVKISFNFFFFGKKFSFQKCAQFFFNSLLQSLWGENASLLAQTFFEEKRKK